MYRNCIEISNVYILFKYKDKVTSVHYIAMFSSILYLLQPTFLVFLNVINKRIHQGIFGILKPITNTILLSSLAFLCFHSNQNQSRQKYVIKHYYTQWANWSSYGQNWFVLPDESNCSLSCPVCSETNELDCAVWFESYMNAISWKYFQVTFHPLKRVLLFYNKYINYKWI